MDSRTAKMCLWVCLGVGVGCSEIQFFVNLDCFLTVLGFCKVQMIWVCLCLCFPSVVDCGDPGAPLHGNKWVGATFLGSIVKYKCNTGFSLHGNSFRVCQSSGKWNGRLPTCTRECHIGLLDYMRVCRKYEHHTIPYSKLFLYGGTYFSYCRASPKMCTTAIGSIS